MEGQRLLVGLHRRSASLRRSCGEDRFVALCDTLGWLEDLAHLGTSAFPVPWQGSLRMGREGKEGIFREIIIVLSSDPCIADLSW